MAAISVGGQDRCVTYPVPRADTAGLPLIVFFHGSGSNGFADHQMMSTTFAGLDLEAAVGDRAVVVYPDGRPHADCGGETCWDRDPDGPDVAFFDAIVDHFEARYGIDRRAVFAMGHSRGGRLTEVLAGHRGDALAGAALIAVGAGNVDSCPQRAPLWITHGVHDREISYAIGVDHLLTWAVRNGCDEPDPDAFPLDACSALSGCEEPTTWCPTTESEWDGHAPPDLADDQVWSFFSALL